MQNGAGVRPSSCSLLDVSRCGCLCVCDLEPSPGFREGGKLKDYQGGSVSSRMLRAPAGVKTIKVLLPNPWPVLSVIRLLPRRKEGSAAAVSCPGHTRHRAFLLPAAAPGLPGRGKLVPTTRCPSLGQALRPRLPSPALVLGSCVSQGLATKPAFLVT